MTKAVFSRSLFFFSLIFSFFGLASTPPAEHGAATPAPAPVTKAHEPEDDGTEWVVEKITESPKDFKVPTKIWELVKDKDQKVNVDSSNQFFVPIKVFLKEKNPGVLSQPALQIEFPKGGGEVDLAKFTTGKSGTFFLNFDFEGFDYPEQLDIFFVSQAKKRRLDGLIHGTGCRKFLDLTQYFLKLKKRHDVIALNTTRQRHLTTLGGHFVFAFKKDKQIFLSKVTFKDDRAPEYFCDTRTESKTLQGTDPNE